MLMLLVFGLVASTIGSPQGYGLPARSKPLTHGGGISGGASTGDFGGSVGGGFESSGKGDFKGAEECSNGQIRHVDGRCVQPIVNRNFFHYTAPKLQFQQGPAPEIPQPKVEYNIVFVRTPETPEGQEPIIVPPPQQKTLVYVLTEQDELAGQKVIEVPSSPHSPEVYYINYGEGENPTLPGGIDLQSALASAAQQEGQVIEGVSSSHGIGTGSGLDGGSGFGGGSFDIKSVGAGSHSNVALAEESDGGAAFGGASFGGLGKLSKTYGTP